MPGRNFLALLCFFFREPVFNMGFLELIRTHTCHFLNEPPIYVSLSLSSGFLHRNQFVLILLQSRSIHLLSRSSSDKRQRRSNRDHSVVCCSTQTSRAFDLWWEPMGVTFKISKTGRKFRPMVSTESVTPDFSRTAESEINRPIWEIKGNVAYSGLGLVRLPGAVIFSCLCNE